MELNFVAIIFGKENKKHNDEIYDWVSWKSKLNQGIASVCVCVNISRMFKMFEKLSSKINKK